MNQLQARGISENMSFADAKLAKIKKFAAPKCHRKTWEINMSGTKDNRLAAIDNIETLVYQIRGIQVMLDSDLADIYGYEVKNLNRQVKRNIDRFPGDFMFQLTKEEVEELRRQNVTANINPMSRSLPYVFSEQGIYMLATVLNGELAVQQSILVMRAFKNMRHYIIANKQLASKDDLQKLALSAQEYQSKTDKTIKIIKKKIDELSENFILEKELKSIVIYKGQKFEADAAYTEIIQSAKKTIYMIDDYVNTKTLQLLSKKKKGVSVILFTENGYGRGGYLTSMEVNDFNTEYPSLTLKPNGECHDRFIVLDYGLSSEKVYHCGASSKDAGRKVCAINAIENVDMIHPFIEKLLKNPNKKI